MFRGLRRASPQAERHVCMLSRLKLAAAASGAVRTPSAEHGDGGAGGRLSGPKPLVRIATTPPGPWRGLPAPLHLCSPDFMRLELGPRSASLPHPVNRSFQSIVIVSVRCLAPERCEHGLDAVSGQMKPLNGAGL